MEKGNNNLSCIVACFVVLVALAIAVYGRGCHSSGGQNAPGSPTSPPDQSTGAGSSGSQDAITVKVSETYYDLVREASETWNRQPDNKLKVQMLAKEGSRDAMQHILTPTGTEPPPDIWLSSTKKLIDDLGAADRPKKHVNLDDSSLIVAFPPQPLVFLVRKRGDDAIGAYLRRKNPLPELPKGKYHYSCADILNSGGGDSAVAYLKWAYQRRGNPSQSFALFLEDLKAKGFVAKLKDSGPLAADFASDTSLDFILVHKALADRERANSSNLYEIVPQTTVLEQPAAVLLQTGVAKHGDKGKDFLRYLKTHLGLMEVNEATPIEFQGDTQNEKRVWEQVFNAGARLDKAKP